MSSELEDSTSSESSSDEEPTGDSLEKDFFKTLSCLKSKDPAIYDNQTTFFNDQPSTSKTETIKQKKQKMFLRDYERKLLLENSNFEDEDNQKPLTYNEEQNQIKRSFQLALGEDGSDEEELFIKRTKTEKEKKEEDEEYISWLKGNKNDIYDKDEENSLKPLKDYWSDPSLDKKEEFLRDYILNKRWKDGGEDEEIDDDSDLSLDGELLEAQDNYEREYNFKDSDVQTEVKRFPRVIEGSLRRKNDSRKKKRLEINERKKEEKNKKMKEIKKAQKEKLQEIKDRLQMLKEATGNDTLGFDENEFFDGDFDPEQHDKLMDKMYGDDFYTKEDADIEKPDIDLGFDLEENDDSQKLSRSKRKKERKRNKKKNRKPTDLTDIVDPSEENFKKVADEFYSLDCEDFIDDIPCRYKYREVEPNDYGLTIEEILAADDGDLNKWAPLTKIYKLRPSHVEKNEVQIYKKKASDLSLKTKLLPSLYKTEDDNNEDNKDDGDDDNVNKIDEVTEINEEKDKSSPKKEISRKEKRFKRKNKVMKSIDEISDNRLLAYDIKPKQFRSKLKFSN